MWESAVQDQLVGFETQPITLLFVLVWLFVFNIYLAASGLS